MHYQEYAPSLHLAPYIEKIWTLETDSSDTYPKEELLTPNGTEGIIISFQDVAQKFILQNQLTFLPEVYVFIQPNKPWKVITEGCSGIIGVFFRAGTLHSIIKANMCDVVGQVIEMQSFLGSKPVRLLRQHLVEAAPGERVAIVENFFSQYLGVLQPEKDITRSVVRLIRQSKGLIPIGRIATEISMSRQAIARQFAQKVGMSPKEYSRVVHFNTVQHFLKKHPGASWLDLTYRFDYFDQSHFIKDFYHFTGMSPKCYAALDPFLVSNFALPDVR